jgi:hypothetical protein
MEQAMAEVGQAVLQESQQEQAHFAEEGSDERAILECIHLISNTVDLQHQLERFLNEHALLGDKCGVGSAEAGANAWVDDIPLTKSATSTASHGREPAQPHATRGYLVRHLEVLKAELVGLLESLSLQTQAPGTGKSLSMRSSAHSGKVRSASQPPSLVQPTMPVASLPPPLQQSSPRYPPPQRSRLASVTAKVTCIDRVSSCADAAGVLLCQRADCNRMLQAPALVRASSCTSIGYHGAGQCQAFIGAPLSWEPLLPSLGAPVLEIMPPSRGRSWALVGPQQVAAAQLSQVSVQGHYPAGHAAALGHGFNPGGQAAAPSMLGP